MQVVGNKIEIKTKEYNRQLRKGRHPDNFYCSIKCVRAKKVTTHIFKCLFCDCDIIENSIKHDYSGNRYCSKDHYYQYLKNKAIEKFKDRKTINQKIADNSTQDNDIDKIIKYLLKISRKRYSKGINSNLSLDFIKKLWLKQDGKCFYTKIPLNINKGTYNIYNPYKASLDRINSSGHYTEDNVVIACSWANTAKNMLSIDQFKHFCSLVK